ncbi:M48 family metalloprotease [Tsuneonella amylolytica]|uniref:M48 family metalloprotease n=1 Tax=Tsuneonella amylolytica TaxID=2338327 RepID=UPI000EA9E67B|nr:M48 family metalloprotease [Tsuneonella amylolytica]
MKRFVPARHAALYLSAAALAVGGCATTGPAVAQSNTGITAAEARQGAEANPQLLQEFGGRMTGPQAQYVEQVGKNIAIQSSLSNARDAFTVSLLNSSVNNAFAIPGGYIYTTRQLVALMNNEAELAGVLGHEVGHVAARHSQKRQSRATQNGILGVLGQVLGSVVGGGFGNLISQGSQYATQYYTLKFSRSQENQADALGVQYLTRAGYDPHAMATVLQSLANQNALDAALQGRGASSTPAWASTHPDPASRVRTVNNLAGSRTGITNRDTFLARIDGLTYGDDPRQGVIEGNQFIHPDLRLSFSAPSGFYLMNGTDAVSINGQSGQAQFKGGAYNGNLETYVRQAFAGLSQQQQIAPQNLQRTTINGIPAMIGQARVNSGNGQVDVTVVAYEFSNNQAYHFVTISQAGRSAVFNPMFQSMRRITSSEAAQVIPRVIDVVTVGSNDTVQSLAARMAYTTAQEQRFRVLNGLSSAERVVPGQKVKLVVRSR